MLQKRYQEDPSFSMQPVYMSEGALSELYSARPVTSSDVIFYQKATKSVFLTTRTFTPGEGLWVIGGGRLAGETATETIVRKVHDETGLAISPQRFQLLGIIEYIWPRRHQAPTNAGRHDINYVFSLEVTDEELASANSNLDPSEYDASVGLQKFSSVAELTAAGVRQNIIDYYQEIFPG